MYKIFTTGNYFFIIDLVSNIEYEGLKKDVRVRRLQADSTAFYFDNVNSWKDTVLGIDISNIQKEDGSAYTMLEFLDFRNYETGNYGITTTKERTRELYRIIDKFTVSAPYNQISVLPISNDVTIDGVPLVQGVSYHDNAGENGVFTADVEIFGTDFLLTIIR